MMYLSKDITSHVNPSHVYGRKGDAVTVISDYHGVSVVEDQNGKRFSVLTSTELTSQYIQPEPAGEQATEKSIIHKVQHRKTKGTKAAPQNSQSLFL